MEVYRLGPAPRLPERKLNKTFLVTVCYNFKGTHETIDTYTGYAPSADAIRRGFEYSLPLGASVSWSIVKEVTA